MTDEQIAELAAEVVEMYDKLIHDRKYSEITRSPGSGTGNSYDGFANKLASLRDALKNANYL